MFNTLPPPPAIIMISKPEARHRHLHSPPALDRLPDGVRESLFNSTGSYECLLCAQHYPIIKEKKSSENLV